MEFTAYSEFDDQLQEEWNALLEESISNVPFLRYEILKAWWQYRGGGEWPQTAELAILVARENGRLLGIAPCFLAEHEEKRALMLLGSIAISDYLDLIVRQDDEAGFVDALIGYVQQIFASAHNIEVLDFCNLLDDSPTLAHLKHAAAEIGWGYEQSVLQPSPYISMPGDWEAYLASIDKKQRHEIRRKMRRAEESDFPVGWYVTGSVDQLEEDSEEFFRLMIQEKDKQEFLTPAMRAQMKELMRTAFNSGILHLAFLTVNGSRAAAYWNFDYNNNVYVYNSGLDRAFMDYSPGWVLLGHLLQWANENGRKIFDFMRGNEEYKYRFGAVNRFVIRAKLEIH